MSAATAAIQFALSDDDGEDFLRYWNEGEFDVIRRNWPDAPPEVFIGADSLLRLNEGMSWALLAVSAIPDEPNAIMAASPDIVEILKSDGDSRYLHIFPDQAGVYVWTGTVNPTEDEVECVEHSIQPADDALIAHYLNAYK